MLEKNESTADKLVRAGAGTALVGVGGVLLITTASGCCPLSRALHFGTAN